MLLDLERRTPVDLLTDRPAQTRAWWLETHPGGQLISPARAGDEARGAKKGAPKAIPVADRFHLSKNLSQVVERLLSPHRQALRPMRFVPTSPGSSSPLAVRASRARIESFENRRCCRQGWCALSRFRGGSHRP
jgi:hypothetical protein